MVALSYDGHESEGVWEFKPPVNIGTIWFVMPPPNVLWPGAYCFYPVRPCMRPCVRPETLLTRYLAEYLTHFHQTYISDAPWDRDERVTF